MITHDLDAVLDALFDAVETRQPTEEINSGMSKCMDDVLLYAASLHMRDYVVRINPGHSAFVVADNEYFMRIQFV